MLTKTYALPSALLELISMMLDHNPSERPHINTIRIAIEDNLEFPRRIEINGDGQGSNPATPDISGHSFSKPLAQEWVERELEQERKSAKVCHP